MNHHDLHNDEREARALLTFLAEPHDRDMLDLVEDYGAAKALDLVFEAEPGDSLFLDEIRKRIEPRLQGQASMSLILSRAEREGIRFVIPGDDEWPDLLPPRAAFGLWVRGIPLPLNEIDKPLAFVGSRASSTYGEQVTADLVSRAATRGHTIVSGAAYGIDAAAHRAAMMSGARTVAWLAGGVDRPYPIGNQDMIERIPINGTLVSLMPPGATPTKWRFLARNRMIARAVDGVVVVESGFRSGSTSTAAAAEEYATPVMAVPGPITSVTSAGCHELIRTRVANMVTSFDDIEAVLYGEV